MDKRKIKKLLILNLPYFLVGLFATNLGEAWRLAEGADSSAKILSFFNALPIALNNPLPSFHPLDLLIGIFCGAGLRLAVYLKGKNAKKYRHNVEYGSARWGTAKDIEPFIAPKFEDNVILTKTERLMMSNRPKNPANARNKNVLIIGGSGSGKTRFWLKPNLLQIPQTAQQSIPFQRMFPDGICRVTDSYYTKTIQFQDINYQLAQQEDKTAIFDEWCSFLNFFDSSIHFELSFMNLSTDAESFEKSIRIPFKKDSFNPVRAEYSQMLKKQLAQGNNGLTKTKYLTFGIEAESMRQAKPRLNHIENDLLNNFRRLGVIATTMNGKERLHLMHSMFHMGDNDKFFFDWKYLVESGLSVKDFIAPTAFAFKTNRTFQMGSIFGAMSYLAITASDLSDRMLADFLDMESTQIVTMHIQSVDQTAAIKTIKRTITELDRSKIEEQKKAVRSGYDMDIIPSDLATYGKDAKSLLKELQSQNERMFMVTFLVLNTGRTEQELENNVFQAQSIAQKHNCNLRRLDFQQESGLMSSLPLAQNLIEIRRGLTTSSTAIFVPFTTQELFQNGGETLYYGLNALSNNLIMVDRKKLKNPNGLILGTPGSGKSFSAKREITNAFLVTDDDIIICDPEAEYAALVHKFNGQVVKISSSSTNYINPMDINLNYSEDVTNSGEGEGLLFYGNVILPFIDRFPTDLELYRIMTTKLNEVAQEKEA